jgi:hypothetical protein
MLHVLHALRGTRGSTHFRSRRAVKRARALARVAAPSAPMSQLHRLSTQQSHGPPIIAWGTPGERLTETVSCQKPLAVDATPHKLWDTVHTVIHTSGFAGLVPSTARWQGLLHRRPQSCCWTHWCAQTSRGSERGRDREGERGAVGVQVGEDATVLPPWCHAHYIVPTSLWLAPATAPAPSRPARGNSTTACECGCPGSHACAAT